MPSFYMLPRIHYNHITRLIISILDVRVQTLEITVNFRDKQTVENMVRKKNISLTIYLIPLKKVLFLFFKTLF